MPNLCRKLRRMDAAAPPLPISKQLMVVASDIKLSHTVFAMPFALLATFLAANWNHRLPGWIEFGLIVMCMITARTFAMAFNRLADHSIDAENKRTMSRALPSGRVSVTFMRVVLASMALAFIAFTSGFWILSENPWPMALSVPVLGVLAGYSLTKRFTWVCHGILGLALAISPIAAAIAIEPNYLTHSTAWLIALMVLAWVAGFDVLYAMQDIEADRALGLYSIPARLGINRALLISRILHAISISALLMVGWTSPQLGLLFRIASVLTVTLLIFEHALVWGGQTKQLHMAFFTINGIISLMLGLAGIMDLLVY